MTKLTKEELLKLKKRYKDELERQALEKEVKNLRERADPGVFKMLDDALCSVFKEIIETLKQSEPDKDARKGKGRK